MKAFLLFTKVFTFSRITFFSFTIFLLVQGLLGASTLHLELIFQLSLAIILLHIVVDTITYRLFKNYSVYHSTPLMLFWLIFIKFSHLFNLFQHESLGIESLFYSLNLGFFGIYLYENLSRNNIIFNKIKISSRLLITLSFLLVILIGSLLLLLPAARSPHSMPIRFIDALFTAISAVCVTGLSVLDTATYFSRFGQVVILCLIQIGALGLVTITIFFMSLLGRKISVSGQLSTKDSTSILGEFSLSQFLSFTLSFTLLCEFLIGVSLFTVFYKHMPLNDALFFSVFHAISSFCNAGFSLFSDSLMGYQNNPIINITIMLAITIGSMGFSTWLDLKKRLTVRSHKKLALQSTIAFRLSAILTIMGALGFFILEYHNALADLDLGNKIMASFFASVNLRTAGFNTIDLGTTNDASRFYSLLFMYIGASPGSTGGGIKTTSFMVLVAAFFQTVNNSDYGIIYGKRINNSLAQQTWALIFQSFAWIFITVMVLCGVDGFDLSSASYEVFSAYGTVGTSIGITSSLSDISKAFISITMVLGRIGPTTVMLALMGTSMKQSLISSPEENLSIG